MNQVGWGIAWEKDDGRIVDKQGEGHLFCCWFALYHAKPFDVGILKQRVRVAKVSQIVSLINWMEVDKETGKYVKICKSKFILNSLDENMLKTRQRKKRINFTKLT